MLAWDSFELFCLLRNVSLFSFEMYPFFSKAYLAKGCGIQCDELVIDTSPHPQHLHHLLEGHTPDVEDS